MSTTLTRLRGNRAVTWRTLTGLILVPLTVAGVLLWGLWNPTARLDTVTAAIVNLDEPVTVDGQTVPMGRVLAAELIGGDFDTNFTWVLTDEDDAAAGLDDGRYATVIVIPENFSSAATSMSRGADEAETATIEVTTSDRGRLLDSALSSIVTTTATAVLNEQLGTQFVGSIFVGMNELGAGIGEAASGASELASGTSGLASGASELASGTTQLSTGASELASGVGQLAGGVSELAVGANGLVGGANELATGAQSAATGGAQLAGGVEQYVGGINSIISQVTGVGGTVYDELARIAAEIEDGTIPISDPALKQQILDGIGEVQAQLESAGSQLGELEAGGTALAQGVRASASGQQELADGLAAYAGGVAQFSGGVSQLAAGAGAAANGASQLAAGTSSLSSGAAELADGARQLSDGTIELADGLALAADGIPSYTEEQSETMAATAVRPVESVGASDELFNAAGVPLFAGIALWAGALASALVMAPLWRRTREAARGVGAVTLRSALPVAGLGAVQGVIAGLVLPLLLGYDLAQGLGFFALALVAGVSFALVNQGLSALLGGVGRFVSFALLVVAFAIGVISTAPPLLQAIGDASPVGALFGGFQAVAMGTAGTGIAIWLLAVWAAGGLALTAFAVSRARRTV